MNETEAWKWVITHMPDESKDALALFTQLNRNYRGAHWEDCLEILSNSDAELEIIEPMAIDMDDWSRLHEYVAITLIFSDRDFVESNTNEERIVKVRDLVSNNGASHG